MAGACLKPQGSRKGLALSLGSRCGLGGPGMCKWVEKDTAAGHQGRLVVHARPLQAFPIEPENTKQHQEAEESPDQLLPRQHTQKIYSRAAVHWKVEERQMKPLLAWSSPSAGEMPSSWPDYMDSSLPQNHPKRWVLLYPCVVSEETGAQRSEVTQGHRTGM